MNRSVFLAAILVVGLVPVAAAQISRDAALPHPGDQIVASADRGQPAAAERRDGRTDLRGDAARWMEGAEGQAPRTGSGQAGRWLARAAFDMPARTFAARASAGFLWRTPGGTRRLVPIPALGWQRRSSLVPNGLVAVNPSLVFGRRLTWAPDLVRGGRTVGVAVQVRVWLTQPAATPALSPRMSILSRVWDLLQ